MSSAKIPGAFRKNSNTNEIITLLSNVRKAIIRKEKRSMRGNEENTDV